MPDISSSVAPATPVRRLPVGAEIVAPALVSFRLWAPDHETVHVVVDNAAQTMVADGDGYHRVDAPARAGSRYGFRLSDDPKLYPDPASRFQPDGPHGLSEVIAPSSYEWHDDGWPGVSLAGQVIYELHVGTFTREGTWGAAMLHLPRLQDLGITTIELMPVGDFPGAFGWGYDGVNWFAPTHLYGRPDDLRRFVDDAHRLSMGVLLDVVYNHLGPSGNYLARFARDYFTDRHPNEWGEAINYDGPRSEHVRELVLSNVEYWIREFHVDGFRLDATHAIYDDSDEHIVAALTTRARASAGTRGILVVAENETQDARLVRARTQGGYGLDAVCSEDFHHTTRVALTGQREAYYSDYAGTAEELLAAVRWGTLFQGQYYAWQNQPRGTPALDLSPERFVCFLENHDQVANSSTGARLADLTSPALLRALTALLLLGRATPMLFQGQEYGSAAPFHYFADHEAGLAERIRAGRTQFLSQFRRSAAEDEVAARRDPGSRATFEASKLDHDLSGRGRAYWRLHQDLLRLRREDPVIGPRAGRWEGATLNDRVLLLRVMTSSASDRLIVVNLGFDFDLARVAHPLVAPPAGSRWTLLWSSEAFTYGGSGTPPLEAHRWMMCGQAVIVLSAES